MDRVRIIVNDVVNYKSEVRLNAAYYKSLEGYFECLHSIVSGYFFASPRYTEIRSNGSKRDAGRIPSKSAPCPSDETVRKMFAIAEGFVKQAELLVSNVVEIDGKLADALEAEVLLVTGKKAVIQPRILTPSLMFRDTSETSDFDSVPVLNPADLLEKDKLFPQIPLSRLSADFCGVLYNALLVLKRAHALRHDSAKNKSNALYLGALRSVLGDLTKLHLQRDGLDYLICQSQDNLELLDLQPAILAEQLSLIDSSLFSHMHVVNELQFAGWLGKERRQRSQYLTGMREFGGYISHWVTWEILKPALTMPQRAKVLIHFVGVGECLAELGSYDMLAAIIRGLSTPAILRLGQIFENLPKRALISWDNLQTIVQDPVRQCALLSKAPATCIPAIDTAYLLDLLTVEPEFLSLNSKGPEAVKKKFTKVCESMERFRLQSTRVYGIKHKLHPAVQHYLLSRPFLSTKELQAASNLVVPPESQQDIDTAPIKPFHRKYLDDDDRLFLPIIRSIQSATEPEEATSMENEHFSLGEQPETISNSFYPLDDAEERAARVNSIV